MTGTPTVTVTDGLFSTTIDGCTSSDVNGQRLYLGIRVGSDGEMTERQPIYPVPYAMTLRPGAVIVDEDVGHITLDVRNGSPPGMWMIGKTAIAGWTSDGTALWGAAGSGTAVWGDSDSGPAVVGWSDSSVGVRGVSNSGVALAAMGTGIIQSTAKSYVWVSGNDLRKKFSTDTTEFECDLYGGVKVRQGSVLGRKDVILPVAFPGQLYGQDVTLTGMDVYFESQGDWDGIQVTAVRRQSGAGSGDIIYLEETPRVCQPACSYHVDFDQNNVLDDEHGVVYIAFGLFFGGSENYVQIGGVRLTLEHD